MDKLAAVGSIEPTPEQFRALAGDVGAPGPIVMLNLLRFREEAAYPDGFGADPCSGREAYERYGAAAQPFLEKVGGAPIWAGPAQQVVIGPEGEWWDVCMLVRYPSRQAFFDMATDEGYLAITPHRSAALSDSRLILCDSGGEGGSTFGVSGNDA